MGTPRGKRKWTILHFTTKLVEEVSGEGKYFLGIDFERLRLERMIPEGSEEAAVHS